MRVWTGSTFLLIVKKNEVVDRLWSLASGLHRRLRSQLELPRQPSEGCSIGALGPVERGEGMWSMRRSSNMIEIDVWPLLAPLFTIHFWILFGSLPGIRFGTHFRSS